MDLQTQLPGPSTSSSWGNGRWLLWQSHRSGWSGRSPECPTPSASQTPTAEAMNAWILTTCNSFDHLFQNLKETTAGRTPTTVSPSQVKLANYCDLNVQGCFYYYADGSFPAGSSDDIRRAHRWWSRLCVVEHTWIIGVVLLHGPDGSVLDGLLF